MEQNKEILKAMSQIHRDYTYVLQMVKIVTMVQSEGEDKMPQSGVEVIKDYFYTTYDLLFEYANSVLLDKQASDMAVQKVFEIALQDISELQKSDNSRQFLLNILKDILNDMR